jgi:hypothetical protein
MSEQGKLFGEEKNPGSESPSREAPALASQFPGPANPQYHAETLLAYLANIERIALYVHSLEDWERCSVDLLDNCRAALVLVKCLYK